MSYRYREEIVGKRFLCVSSSVALDLKQIKDFGWRAGVIRASSRKDSYHPDLQVLVEFDDVEWHRREWIHIYRDNIFKLFLVEDSLVWAKRPDPDKKGDGSKVLWPALTFRSLQDTADLANHLLRPIEFLVSRGLEFQDYHNLNSYQDLNSHIGVKNRQDIREAIKKWTEHQDGQRILLTTPSVLVGYRVEVYRAEGTTQWYTAVIVGYNDTTRELTVTDDTVLEEHSEDPCLVQMRLIGDGVVDSILKGENIGITPRRCRATTISQQQIPHISTSKKTSGARSNVRKGLQSTTGRSNRKPRPVYTAVKDRLNQKARSCSSDVTRDILDSPVLVRRKERKKTKVEKKKLKSKAKNKNTEQDENRPKVVEKSANVVNSVVLITEGVTERKRPENKIPVLDSRIRNLQVKVVPCCAGIVQKSSKVKSPVENPPRPEAVTVSKTTDEVVDEPTESVTCEEPRFCSVSVITLANRTSELVTPSTSVERESSSSDGLHPEGWSPASMESDATSSTRPLFPDDHSDSGVSVGSSSTPRPSGDEPQQRVPATTICSEAIKPLVPNKRESVRVWRDPALVSSTQQPVRHISSLQHRTLMAHTPGSVFTTTSGGGIPISAAPMQSHPPAQLSPYPTTALLSPHHPGLQLPPHLQYHVAPPEMIWKTRYPHLTVSHPSHTPEDQRERMAQQERLIRERREHEAAAGKERERHERDKRERQERERHLQQEKMDRERKHNLEQERLSLERDKMEKQRQEQRATEEAVQHHFEESLRVAQQKTLQGRIPTAMGWAGVPGLPMQRHQSHHPQYEEELKRQEDERRRDERRRMSEHDNYITERRRQEEKIVRERGYYIGQQNLQQRQPHSAPKVEFPPKVEKQRSSALPKAEPNFNLFNYSHYQQHYAATAAASAANASLEEKTKMAMNRKSELPAPPPLLSDNKGVIVQGDKHVSSPSKGHMASYPSAPQGSKLDYRHMPLQPHLEAQNLMKPAHPSPAHNPHPSSPPFGYKMVTQPSYPYTAMPHQTTATALLKPKVSSPAPPQIYGKPTMGMVVSAPETIPSPTPLTIKPNYVPPPAHSSNRVYQTKSPIPQPSSSPAVQMQPLDLGITDSSRESSTSPKRKTAVIDNIDVQIKKRRVEPTPPLLPSQPPVLARVSEPSPLMTGAASTISMVVNTAAFSARKDLLPSPKPAAEPTPEPCKTTPPPAPTPPQPSQTPVVQTVEDKPTSPKAKSYPIHKLKKAWLVRHTGEDSKNESESSSGTTCSVMSVPPATPTPNAVTTTIPKGMLSIPLKACRKPKARGLLVMNGHHTPDSKIDDSSSSTSETEVKPPPKRKPPKTKRKGGNKKESKALKIKAPSESGTESEHKDSGSEKDSDNGQGGSGSSNKRPPKEAKKRGRKPKPNERDNRDEKRPPKKSRDDSPPAQDPFRKPPVSQLKKSGDSFLQDGPCWEVAPKLGKCRECRWTPHQRNKKMTNIFCRFYAFRRLRYTKSGQLAIAGFSDPHKDASEDDLKLWLSQTHYPPKDLDLETAIFLISQVGDQFCDLITQEKEAINLHMGEDDKVIAWKRVVQGVREMCDVCETTLFNYHWACSKCGFVVCIDCYKGRRSGTIKLWGEPSKDRDEFSWLLCTNRQAHEQDKLMLTQIIAGSALQELGKQLHHVRHRWAIPHFCGCPDSIKGEDSKIGNNGINKGLALLKSIKKDKLTSNGLIKQEKIMIKSEAKDVEKNGKQNGSPLKKEEGNSALNWLADVALGKDKKDDDDDSSESEEGEPEEKKQQRSTLRELLLIGAEDEKKENSNSNSEDNEVKPPKMSKIEKEEKAPTIDDVIARAVKKVVDLKSEDCKKEVDSVQLKHFVRKYNYPQTARGQVPTRIMTKTESSVLYPNVNHAWLCDGRLLRLKDPTSAHNLRIFQDQWKRGQPVLVSEVSKKLNMSLWHPEAFIRDFGEIKNDLINCMTGNIVPNQPMKKFWEGFELFSKRLKDEKGNYMLLKLKDWPPGEDFAELLPTRFQDLMKVLPLSEYTHRSGCYNLTSRLPESFVRPDLGPKMYNAYGSALYPKKGTTNLHLDISDAVNVMVYVGIPKDGNSEEHITEALNAIDNSHCDLLTRRRVREKGELPGALWHIYNPRDADKIRDLLNLVALERGGKLEPHNDPIHDQSFYLDSVLRERLYKEYGVEGYAIAQCLGDAVFIPAGAPHQVRNLHNCIKVAEDFVSPENVAHCFHLTQEFRELSDTHSNHEDKLQIKNIIYHAVKDALSVITSQELKQLAIDRKRAVASDTPDVKIEKKDVKNEPADIEDLCDSMES